MLFYDFEVFKKYWCVVIADTEKKDFITISNRDELQEFYEAHIDDIWIGYNSKGYDQFILKGILLGYDPKVINDWIIVSDQSGWSFCEDFRKIKLINYDAIVKRGGNFIGLKELEYHMGDSIIESDVEFSLDRELTEAEKDEVIRYCKNDVEALMKIFLIHKDKFDAHLGLIKLYNLPISNIDLTDARLTAKILKAKRQTRLDEFNIMLPDTLQLEKYNYIAEWYMKPENRSYDQNLETMVYGIKHSYGWGGFHSARENYIEEGVIFDSDIASLYPSLMIEYSLLSRNIPEIYFGLYEQIKENRIKLKKEKNPLQAALKLILNTTYGTMKDVNNDLYDPQSANLVCIYGQLLMTDLIEHLEVFFGKRLTLIQSNTDGIFVKLESEDLIEDYKRICDEWSDRVGLKIEHDRYKKIIQKDVNNYIAIAEDGIHKKGAYVKGLSKDDYELSVINEAIVKYFVDGILPEDTIRNNNNLKDFQMLAKKSQNYLYLIHDNKKLDHKYYRVFASKNQSDDGIFKVGKRGTKEKIANTPQRCFIDNGNVNGKGCPEILDKDYYIEMAYSRIAQFIGRDIRQRSLI